MSASAKQFKLNLDRTIFRVVKNRDNPYVMMDKRPLENPKLSWRAKGMLAYLLSRPDTWTVRLQDLLNRSPDGDYIVRQTIRELAKAGHMRKRVIHRDHGRGAAQWIWDVFESPDLQLREDQQVKDREIEHQQVEDRVIINNDSVSKKETETDNEDDVPTEKDEAIALLQSTASSFMPNISTWRSFVKYLKPNPVTIRTSHKTIIVSGLGISAAYLDDNYRSSFNNALAANPDDGGKPQRIEFQE